MGNGERGERGVMRMRAESFIRRKDVYTDLHETVT